MVGLKPKIDKEPAEGSYMFFSLAGYLHLVTIIN